MNQKLQDSMREDSNRMREDTNSNKEGAATADHKRRNHDFFDRGANHDYDDN